MAELNILGLSGADAVYNGMAFGIRTKSGGGGSAVDDEGATHFLSPNASNDALGAAVCDCLTHSRILSGDAYRRFFSKDTLKRNELSWRRAQTKKCP